MSVIGVHDVIALVGYIGLAYVFVNLGQWLRSDAKQ